jgi:hypothetical protein
MPPSGDRAGASEDDRQRAAPSIRAIPGAKIGRFGDSTGPLEGLDSPKYVASSTA